MNWRTVEGLVSWETYRDYIITNGGGSSNFMDAQYEFWLAGLNTFSPLDLSPALWVDPSDASSVTISGSSGAYIGPNGLVCSGVGANYATVADIAAYTVTDEFELILKATPATWAQTSTVVSSKSVTAAEAGFRLTLNSGVGIYFSHSDGATHVDSLSSVNHSFTNGVAGWIKVTYKGSLGEVKFYTSTDGSSYTQLGTTQTTTILTGWNSTLDPQIGQRIGGSLAYTGTVNRVSWGTVIGGTKVFDADFEAATPYVSAFTESAVGAPVYVVSSTATTTTANYTYVGPTGLVCSGSGANYATVPDAANLTPSTTLEILTRAAAPDYTPTASSSFCAKRADSASNFGYHFKIETSGTLSLIWGTSSTTVSTDTSTVASGLTDGTQYWFRVLKDFSTGTADFYYASDSSSVPSSWTAIGTQVAGSTGTPYNDTNTLAVGVGATNTGGVEQWSGTIARTVVKSNGTTVFDADFVSAVDYVTTFTESSSNAATVTITATNTPANAAGALVSQINDLSGNARHLTQATAANMPKYWNGRNGYNTLVFDTASDYLEHATAADWTALHDGTSWLLSAAWRPNTAGTRGLLGNQANNARGVSVYASSATNLHLSIRTTTDVVVYATEASRITFDTFNVSTVLADPDNVTASARSSIFFNGGSAASSNAALNAPVATAPTQKLFVGALNNAGAVSSPLNGQLAELVLVTGANATEGNRTSLVTYTNTKWAVY